MRESAVLVFVCVSALAAGLQFNRDVRPILADRCFACHGPDKGNRKAELRLDVEADAKAPLKGSRFAIVPGSPETSEVFKRITTTNKALRMPPAYMGHDALPQRDIDLLRSWIQQGAEWQAHWSFIPPRKAPLPSIPDAGWAKTPIDYFVLSRLTKEGLRPAPPANKRTLLRRVTFDLTGLPPTPEETEAFLRDESPQALEHVVDRLLASPRYGVE